MSWYKKSHLICVTQIGSPPLKKNTFWSLIVIEYCKQHKWDSISFNLRHLHHSRHYVQNEFKNIILITGLKN